MLIGTRLGMAPWWKLLDMSQRTNTQYLRNNQYQDASNLNARIQIHQRFSTNPANWFRWVFDHLDISRVANILDLGCGPGLLWTNNLDRLQPDHHIYLSDFSLGMLSEAYQNIHNADINFSYIVIDAKAIPLPSESLSIVIANHMLYHVPNRPLTIKEIHRILKPGGKLVAATNGENHMAQIDGLLSRLDPPLGAQSDYAFGISEFTLENGNAQLTGSFVRVKRILFPGNLEVTEAEPLLAYLHSMITATNENTNPQGWIRIRQMIDQEISMKGSFHISKSTGLFIAEKSMIVDHTGQHDD